MTPNTGRENVDVVREYLNLLKIYWRAIAEEPAGSVGRYERQRAREILRLLEKLEVPKKRELEKESTTDRGEKIKPRESD